MPTIPIYDAPQVKAQGLPDTQLRVNIPNMAAPIAQGLGAVSAVAQQKADEAQVSVVNEATRKVREELNGLTEYVASVKDPRNPKNWGGREGQSLQGWFEEQAKALIESQRNGIPPSALDRFDSSVLPVAETMRHTVSTHEAALFDQVHDDTYNANMGAARQSVALTAVDPKGRLNQAAVTINEQDIRQQVAEIGRRKQWSPEKIRAEEIRQLSPTHAIVVQGLLDAKNMEAARNYFATAKADMTPETMRELSARVEVGTDYEIGDTLYNKYVPGLTIENYAERQKQINQEESLKNRPQVRAHVLQMLHSVVAADVAAKTAASDAALDKVAAVGFSKGVYAAMSSPEMQVLAKLDPSRAEQKKRQYEAEARRIKNESTPADATESMFRMAALLKSDGFLFKTEQQLKQDLVGMTTQDQRQTIATWSEYKANPKAWNGDKSLIEEALHKAGILESDKSYAKANSSRRKMQDDAFNQLSTALREAKYESGKLQMTPEQQKKKLDELISEVVIKNGKVSDSKMKTFEIAAKLADPAYSKVKRQMQSAALNNGLGVGQREMVSLYSRALAEGAVIEGGANSGMIDLPWLLGQPEVLGHNPKKWTAPPTSTPSATSTSADPLAGARDYLQKFAGGPK